MLEEPISAHSEVCREAENGAASVKGYAGAYKTHPNATLEAADKAMKRNDKRLTTEVVVIEVEQRYAQCETQTAALKSTPKHTDHQQTMNFCCSAKATDSLQ